MLFWEKKHLLLNSSLSVLSRQERRDALWNCTLSEEDSVKKQVQHVNKSVIELFTGEKEQLKRTAQRISLIFPDTFPLILKTYPWESERINFLRLHDDTLEILSHLKPRKLQIILDVFSLEVLKQIQSYHSRIILKRIGDIIHPDFSWEVFQSIFWKDFDFHNSRESDTLFFRFSWAVLTRLYLVLWEDINDKYEKQKLSNLNSMIMRRILEIGIPFLQSREQYQRVINELTSIEYFDEKYEKDILIFLRRSKNFEDFIHALELLNKSTKRTLVLANHTKNKDHISHFIHYSYALSKNILKDIISRNKNALDIFVNTESPTSLADLFQVYDDVYFFMTSHIDFSSVKEILSFKWTILHEQSVHPKILSFCASIEIPTKDTFNDYLSSLKILRQYPNIWEYSEIFSKCSCLQEVIDMIDASAWTLDLFFRLSKEKQKIITSLPNHYYGTHLFFTNPDIYNVLKWAFVENLETLLKLTQVDSIKWLEKILSIPWISDILEKHNTAEHIETLFNKYSYNVFSRLLWDESIQKIITHLPIQVFRIVLRNNRTGKDLIQFLWQNKHLTQYALIKFLWQTQYVITLNNIENIPLHKIYELIQHEDIYRILCHEMDNRMCKGILQYTQGKHGEQRSFSQSIDELLEEKIEDWKHEKVSPLKRKKNILKVNTYQIRQCYSEHDVHIEWDISSRTLVLYFRQENMELWQYLTLVRTAFHYVQGWYSQVFNKVTFVPRKPCKDNTIWVIKLMYPEIGIHNLEWQIHFWKLSNHFANTTHLTHSSTNKEAYMQESTHIIGIANMRDGDDDRVPKNGNYALMPILFTRRYGDSKQDWDNLNTAFNIKEVSHLFWDALIACEEKMLSRCNM